MNYFEMKKKEAEKQREGNIKQEEQPLAQEQTRFQCPDVPDIPYEPKQLSEEGKLEPVTEEMLKNMKLHDLLDVARDTTCSYSVLRVPGGFLYISETSDTNVHACSVAIHTIFIPEGYLNISP